MYLFEEYFSRHGMKVHAIKHTPSGCVLFLMDNLVWKSRWIIVSIVRVDSEVHPSFYRMNFHCPIHDGYLESDLFNKVAFKELEMDEYEEYLFNWRQNALNHGTPVKWDDVLLNAWEMFAFIYDGWFCRQNSELRFHLERSLDDGLPAGERVSAHQNCLIYLSQRHSPVYRAWSEVYSNFGNYSHWLVDLISGN